MKLSNELTTSVLTENNPCRKLSIAIHLRGSATSSSLCLKWSSDGASFSEIPKSAILMTKCESILLIEVGQFTYYKQTYNNRLLKPLSPSTCDSEAPLRITNIHISTDF